MTDDTIIDAILAHEGGYSDHPADRGGETMYGISRVHHPDMWVNGRPTLEAARAFYRARYLAPFAAVEPITLRAHVVDIAVNSGIKTARTLLARAQAQTVRDVGLQLVFERLRFYMRIVKANPSQAVFLEGWYNRAVSFA